MDQQREPEAPAADADTASKAPANSKSTSPDPSPDLGRAVGKIAARMQKKGAGLSTGDMAELRRISPDRPFTPALWRMLLWLEVGDAPGWIGQSTWERRWATLLMGMAFCTGLHDYSASLGRALAEAGWSELRFVRLMRAEGDALEAEVRRIAQYLAGKSQRANWTDVARLLFYQSGETAQNIRLSIARRYYRALYAKEQQS